MKQPKMTGSTQAVLRALLVDSSREMYGLEVCKETEYPPGPCTPS